MKKLDFIKLHNELKRPLVLDGAVGSLLHLRGIKVDKYLWTSTANLTQPHMVHALHKEYIEAGADIITTNTFRTNPSAVKNSGLALSPEQFVEKSVSLALEARGDKKVLIAGSNAPAEDCYQRERKIPRYELYDNHIKHIEYLWQSGCDFILNETQSHLDEIKIICEYCCKNKIPYIISFFFTHDLKLLSGEPLAETVGFAADYSPIAIGLNCIDYSSFKDFINSHNINSKWGFYLNCGSGSYTDELITCGIRPKDYITQIKNHLEKNLLFVGSCCGSDPLHTKMIREYLDEFYRDKSSG